MAGKTFCVAGACALALCLALISHVPSSSGPVGLEGSVSDTQRRRALDAALQRLSSRHARPGRDVRGALEDLEHNLEGELHRYAVGKPKYDVLGRPFTCLGFFRQMA